MLKKELHDLWTDPQGFCVLLINDLFLHFRIASTPNYPWQNER